MPPSGDDVGVRNHGRVRVFPALVGDPSGGVDQGPLHLVTRGAPSGSNVPNDPEDWLRLPLFS